MKYSTAFWKPTKENKGSAVIFEYSPDSQKLFVSLRPQASSGDTKFNKDGAINAKLDEMDLGEMLLVLEGNQRALGNDSKEAGKFSGRFHKNEAGNTSIFMEWGDDTLSKLRFSMIANKNGNKSNVGINLTSVEARILREFLIASLRDLFRSEFSPQEAPVDELQNA